MQLPPPIHGVTVVNQIVATSELLASRFDVEVLPIACARTFEELGRATLGKLVRMLQTSTRLAHALVARRPDAVYFTPAPAGAALYRDCLLVALVKLAGVPRIFHLHGRPRRAPDTGDDEPRWQSALRRWVFRDAWVIVLSERLVSDIDGLVPRSRVVVVPNGVAQRSAPARSNRRGPARLLFLSNVTRTKGPLVLIEALALLRARGFTFEVTLAGAVHEDAFLERCHAAIRHYHLEQRVHFVGPAYDEAKDRLLAEHDVLVLPTTRDALPLVVLEAMQAGLPVVTTNIGALPEVVQHGATGLVVPPGDPEALADGLAVLLADRDLRCRMGASGRARWLQNYTQIAFEQNLVTALTTCMRTPNASSPGARTGHVTGQLAGGPS